jgi:hypothetical protein
MMAAALETLSEFNSATHGMMMRAVANALHDSEMPVDSVPMMMADDETKSAV